MWCANVGRPKTAPDSIEPDFGQRPENGIESSKSEGCNVLQEDVAASHIANGICEGEEETRLRSVDACAGSGKADVGAGKAADNHVCTASELTCWDRPSVGPHRRLSEASRFHTRRQPLDGCELVLHVEDAARLWKDSADGVVELAGAAEEAFSSARGRYTHIHPPPASAAPGAAGNALCSTPSSRRPDLWLPTRMTNTESAGARRTLSGPCSVSWRSRSSTKRPS